MRPRRKDAPSLENYVDRLETYADVLEDRISRLTVVMDELADDLGKAKDTIGTVLFRHRWAAERAERGPCDCDTCMYLIWKDGEAVCERDEEMTPLGRRAMERGACPLWGRVEE